MFLTSKKPESVKSQPRKFDEIIALLDSAYGGATKSGVHVNSITAMQQSTIWSCVRILSEIIAQLPIEVHRYEGGKWVNARDHDIIELLAEPNQWQTQHDLISTLISWAELEGNGYLFKNTNARGKVLRLLPLEARSVDVETDQDWSIKYLLGGDKGPTGWFEPEKIFHLRNFGSSGYKGLSTIGNHREGIGLALQLETHAVQAYKNGLQTNKWVELERQLGKDELAEFKSQLSRMRGAENAGEVPVFAGAKIHALEGMSATDAQYIESRKMQKEELSAVFGVPLFILNSTEKSTTWGSGLEQISRSFVRFSLNPRLNRLGQTIVKELVPVKDRRNTRVVFDTDQFTLGDFKERMEGYRAGIESGVLNPDQCLEMEGRNPRPGGEKFRIPLNIGIEGQENEDETPNPSA